MKWDSESLWLKSKQYCERAHIEKSGSAQFGLYCALSLEFLARAALASVHPALLADSRDVDAGLLHAFGYESRKQARSADMSSVVSRLIVVVPAFDEHAKLCNELVYLRNAELHTGEPAFEGRKEFGWLPRYYGAVKALCLFMKRDLPDLLDDHASAADALVGEAQQDLLGAVKKRIQAHREVFASKPQPDRDALVENSKQLSMNERIGLGPRIDVELDACPACAASLRKFGSLVSESEPRVVEDSLLVDRTSLVQRAACPACGFHLDSPAEVRAAGIEPRFTDSVYYDPRDMLDLHERESEPEYMDM